MRPMGGRATRPSNWQEEERSQRSQAEMGKTRSVQFKPKPLEGRQGLGEALGRREGNSSLLVLP